MTTLRAHFDGRVLVPDQPVDLPSGQPLEIQVRPITGQDPSQVPGSPQAILRTLSENAPVEPGAIEEMNREIEEGKLPVQQGGIFDESE